MICPTYPPYGISGASRYYYDVSRKFVEKGIYVDIITPSIKKKEKKKQGKLTVHRIPAMNWTKSELFMKKSRRIFKYLKKYINKKKVDLFSSQHLNMWSLLNPGMAMASNLISMNNEIPNILTLHMELNQDPDNINNLPIRYLFWSKIIGVSSNIAEKVHSLGVNINKISTCYPGVDLEQFKPNLGKKWLRSRINVKEKDRIILFAGRISEAKGVPTLLKAFSNVAEKRRVKLLIAAAKPGNLSDKEFKESIENTYEKAKLLGFRDKIIIKPFKLEEMPHVYNGCDIFAMPSQYEGFGLVYAEAMACKLPVIGTSVGGVPEIITNGEDGYLIPPENPTELAKRLEWLLRSKKRREKMGKAGLKKVREKFDLNKTTEKLLGLYKSSIQKNGNGKNKKGRRGQKTLDSAKKK